MLKVALLSLTILLLANCTVSEVKVTKSPLGFETKALELETLIPILEFVTELKGLYHEVEEIRKKVPESPTETIEIWDHFNNTHPQKACKSCLNFVGQIRKISDSKIIMNMIEKYAETACEKKQAKNVCQDAIASYGEEVFEVLLDRTIRPERLCERFALCPRTIERDRLKDFVKDVLGDKPAKKAVKATKKGTYKVLQLSDPHVDLLYKEGANAYCDEPLCCRAESGTPADASKAAPHWGSLSKCDMPRRTFEQFLNFTASNFEIDMIIWTGDNIAHDIWQQNVKNQTLPTYDITQDIMKYFPNTFVYPMFGNHEPYPCNQFDPSGNASAWLTNQLSDMWKGWLDETAAETFRKHSYYAINNEKFNVKVIGLNTEACDTDDYYLIKDPEDPMGQLRWLITELYEAEKNGQSVFILGHIPTGSYGCYDQWSSRYRALVERFSNIIKGQFFGHTHNDHFQIARSFEDDTPIGVNFIAPSFTTFSYQKPSFRIYEYDVETNVPVNIHQYRLDLNKWNKHPEGPLEFDLAYSFLEEYNLPDMSPESFDLLAERIKKNPELAKKFQYNHDSGSHAQGDMTEREIKNLYCGLKHSVSENHLKCLGLDMQVGDIMSFAKQFLPGKWYADKC